MQFYLIRAWLLEDLGETTCAICQHPFVAESVLMMSDEATCACPACIEYLGRRNPESFPSIEEYEAAKRRFPDPIWACEEDVADLDPYCVFTNEVSVIERA